MSNETETKPESTPKPAKQRRGFAAMSAEKQRQIASLGGKAAHAKGTAHEFNAEEARRAGQRGGLVNAARVKREKEESVGAWADGSKQEGLFK